MMMLEEDLLSGPGDAAARTRWLAVMSHLDPRYGGLSAVVPRLGMEMAHSGVDMELAAFCAPGEFYVPEGMGEGGLSHWPTSRVAWLTKRELRERLRETIRPFEGVHVHGLWEQSTASACGLARELRKPYVLSAHGMLEPWALRNKQVKKYLYATLSERGNVQGAACLHALTVGEALTYRWFGAQGPIAVIPNGVTVPKALSAELFLGRYPELKGKRNLLFMSRLHPKKGLDLLVPAWAQLAKRWPDAHLVIAGPDFEGTLAKTEQMVAEYELGERVLFTGMLDEAMKWSALAACECFVLPSHSEGLSMSALEAMGAGLPVIVTEPCNMPEVSHFDLGWEIGASMLHLASAMREMLENSPASNVATGARGRRLIEERYAWPIVARQMAEVYRWVEGGPEPESVEVMRG